MLKLFGWIILREEALDQMLAPKPLPELIVCRTEQDAQPIRRQLEGQRHITVVTASNGVRGVCGIRPPQKITVMPGVNLDMVTGEGNYRAILKSRQATWGDLAVMVVL